MCFGTSELVGFRIRFEKAKVAELGLVLDPFGSVFRSCQGPNVRTEYGQFFFKFCNIFAMSFPLVSNPILRRTLRDLLKGTHEFNNLFFKV